MTKRQFSILIVIIAILSIGYVIYDQNRPTFIGTMEPQKDHKIEENAWKELSKIDLNDTTKVIKIEYAQKYGSVVTIYCMAIFENNKTNQLKCIAPWKTIIIEKSNTNYINISKINKSEAKL